MRLLLLLCALGWALFAFTLWRRPAPAPVSPPAVTVPDEYKRGEELAKVVCNSCHLQPAPEQLDKVTWAMEVLPAMAMRLGFHDEPYDLLGLHERVMAAKIIPEAETAVTLGLRDNQAVFSTGETTFVSRLIEGQFPNYQQLLPANYETRIVADKEELTAAAKRVALFAQHSAPIRLLFEDGAARLSAASQDLGGASEEITVEQEGATIEIALNAQFLIDGLATMSGEKVAIELTTPLKPGLLRSVEQEHLYLIMPVRIS